MGAGKEGGGYWEHTTKGGRELFLEKRRKGRGIGKEGGGYWEHTTKTDVPFFNVSYYEAVQWARQCCLDGISCLSCCVFIEFHF